MLSYATKEQSLSSLSPCERSVHVTSFLGPIAHAMPVANRHCSADRTEKAKQEAFVMLLGYTTNSGEMDQSTAYGCRIEYR